MRGDYQLYQPSVRSCCPEPFFRASAKRTKPPDLNEEEAHLLAEMAAHPWQPRHLECKQSCIADTQLPTSLLPEGSGRSDVEASDQSFVLPAGSSWLQGDVFGDRNALSAAGLVPSAGFAAAVVDPPWESKNRGVHYRTCTLKQLFDLPFPEVLAHGAIVAVWVTNDPNKQFFVRKQLLPKWGLDFIGEWTWLKVTNSGEPVLPLGRDNHGRDRPRRSFEKVLVGQLNCASSTSLSQEWKPQAAAMIAAVPGRHSQKPFLDCLLPPGPKLEVFARNLRPGWTSWGNEVLRFQDQSLFEPLTSTPPDMKILEGSERRSRSRSPRGSGAEETVSIHI